jgi:AcrR family transcriptional regulator
MPSNPIVVRPYRGVSPEDRSAHRRERLLEAGLQVFGTEGYANSSVRRICEVAGLNQRYFYESFETREELLASVYEEIVRRTRSSMIEAVLATQGNEERVRAGLTAWWRTVTEDRRRARVLAIEVVGVSESLEQRRREIRHAFADFVVMQAAGAAAADSQLDPVVVGRSLVAAVIELVTDWLRSDIPYDVDGLVDQSTRMFLLVGSALYPGGFRPVAD